MAEKLARRRPMARLERGVVFRRASLEHFGEGGAVEVFADGDEGGRTGVLPATA